MVQQTSLKPHHFQLRFNTKHGDTNLYWRVFDFETVESEPVEHLVSDLRINVSVYAQQSTEFGVMKHNIACDGFLAIVDGVAYINDSEGIPAEVQGVLNAAMVERLRQMPGVQVIDREPGWKRPLSEKFVARYFENDVEYPRNFPWSIETNTNYCYVASTKINSFLPEMTIVSAFVIGRYMEMDEPLEMGDDALTKRKVIDRFNEGKAPPHKSNLNQFGDDVLLLGHPHDQDGLDTSDWVYIWCDHDTSDCCIGRFSTEDSGEDVKRRFEDYANESSMTMGYEGSGMTAVPLNIKHLSRYPQFF